MGKGQGKGAGTACVKLFRDLEEAGGGRVCSELSTPEGLLTADSDPGAHLHAIHVKPN